MCAHVDAVKLRLRGYSNMKVPAERLCFCDPGWTRRDNPTWGFIVLGRGFGHVTKQADRHELGAKLRKLASDCGANAIDKASGTEFRVQFLRIQDDVVNAALRQRIKQREP
jgi:hypothetical protein